jgi:monoterpene epsilon-lactone hydrolase
LPSAQRQWSPPESARVSVTWQDWRSSIYGEELLMKSSIRKWIRMCVLGTTMAPFSAIAADPPRTDAVPSMSMTADGATHIANVDLAVPTTLSPEAHKAFLDYFARGGDPIMTGDITAMRKIFDEQWAGPVQRKWQALLPVNIEHRMIAGVSTDIVTSTAGVAPGKADKVLISLHGGGFFIGNGGPQGRVEAIPMAGYGKYRVIAVDYRQGPEYHYPAATDDVVAVYRELLKTYKPENIGIYGSSAGGILTAQAVARFQKENLPAPGAIAIMAAGATVPGRTDSSMWALGFTGVAIKPTPIPKEMFASYFKPQDFTDPLAAPANAPAILAKFPPSLVLSSSRDALLGFALDTHARMLDAGVDAQLYVRDGLGHGYFTQMPEIPETTAAWRVTVQFFDKKLGHAAK